MLIDGPYIEALADRAGPWAGSGNQRVIDLAATRRAGQVVLVDERSVHPLDDTSRGVKTYVIALLGLLWIYPFVWMVSASLKSSTSSISRPRSPRAPR